MMESIKESPYYVPHKNNITLRCHQPQTPEANKRECSRYFNCFVRNFVNEIANRENRMTADEMVQRKDGETNDSQ